MGLVDLLVVIAYNYDSIDPAAIKVVIAEVYDWFERIEKRVRNETEKELQPSGDDEQSS